MPARYRFGRFVLDERSGTLSDAEGAIALQPKSFELLLLLLAHPGVLWSREELFKRLWPGVKVTEDSLHHAIARVRRAVSGVEIIETVPRRGYRLAAEVQREEEAPRPVPPLRTPALTGRDADVAMTISALREGKPVLICGPPGIGKSAVARAVRDGWGGATLWRSVGEDTSRDALVRNLARALTLGDAPTVELARRVITALAARDVPLVILDLDGAEGLSGDACATLAEWIDARCAAWLMTSRTRLSSPALETLSLGPLGAADGVSLLVSRLPLGQPPPSRESLLSLVTALDGNPLALELAGARLRVLAPGALLEALDRPLVVLRDADRSLEASIAASAGLLDDIERRAVVSLAVVDGPLAFEAVEALLAPLGGFVPDLLQRLDDRCWLSIDRGEGLLRYGLGRTLRAWVREHAADPATTRAAVDRLARWLGSLGEPLAALLRDRPDPGASAWLREQCETLLALVRHPALAPERRSLLVRIAGVALRYHGTSEQMIALCQGELVFDDTLPIDARLRLRWALAQARGDGGSTSVEVCEDAVALAEASGSIAQRSLSYSELAFALHRAGRDLEARPVAHRAVALAHDAGDVRAIQHALAQVASATWGTAEAVDALRQILALPNAPDAWVRIRARCNLAILRHDAGFLDEAEVLYTDALASMGDAPPWMRAPLLGNLGNLLADRGQHEASETRLLAAAQEAGRGGLTRLRALYRLFWGHMATDRGDPETGEARIRSVLDERPSPLIASRAQVMLGLAAWRSGNLGKARAHLDLAVEHAEGSDAQDALPAWSIGALVAVVAGDLERSVARYARAQTLLRATRARSEISICLLTEGFQALARARGASEPDRATHLDEARRAAAALRARGEASPDWPDGQPPLADGVRHVAWIVPILEEALRAER